MKGDSVIGRRFVAVVSASIVGGALIAGAMPASAADPSTDGAQPASVDHRRAQWWLDAAGLDAIHRAGFTGAGVRVGVIDSVIDPGHGDLEGRVVEQWVLEGDRIRRSTPGEYRSRIGHATHVASIVAGKDDGYGITGVAPDAEIVALELPGAEGLIEAQVTGAHLADAIRHVAGRDVDVINMSLGFGLIEPEAKDLRPMCEAIADVTQAGVVVVASAGNSGADGNPEFLPAACDGAISVGAVDSDLISMYWSSYDRTVTVSAPGADIAAAMDRGLDRGAMVVNFHNETHPVMPMSGTSMAGPFVAGVVALLRQQQPAITPQQVRARLIATALDRGRTGFDPRYGYGVVDAARALGLAGSIAPAPQLTLTVKTDWARTYLSWNSQGTDVAISRLTLSFVDLDGISRVEESLDPDALRAFIPTPTVDGFWQMAAETADGGVFTSTRVYAAPEPMMSSPPVEVLDDGVRWTQDGRLALTWGCRTALRDTMSIHYSMTWQRPKHFRKLLPPGIRPGAVRGTFASCADASELIVDPAEYRYVVDGVERTGRLTGAAAAAVRQYAAAGYGDGSVGTFSLWAEEGGRELGSRSEFLPFPTGRIKSWFVKDGAEHGRLYVQIDPSALTSSSPRVTVSVPSGRQVSLDVNQAGYATVRLPWQSGAFAAFDLRGSGVEGLSSRTATRIYAFRTDDCVPCRLGLATAL